LAFLLLVVLIDIVLIIGFVRFVHEVNSNFMSDTLFMPSKSIQNHALKCKLIAKRSIIICVVNALSGIVSCLLFGYADFSLLLKSVSNFVRSSLLFFGCF
jgi:hypothetical protein